VVEKELWRTEEVHKLMKVDEETSKSDGKGKKVAWIGA
jgi:hypothetical protein